jgi:hypothetical protein
MAVARGLTVTAKASSCDDCGLVTVTPSDVGVTLDRLPPALFNRDRPATEPGEGAKWDVDTFDNGVFDEVVTGDDVTLQYELARLLTREKDRFVLDWRTVEALQLGLGTLVLNDDGTVVSGDGIRARGADLDRLGEQYGIGRPQGFTDCCYWKLVQLILFTAGATTWKLLEIAELYTGHRPLFVETPAKIALIWPVSAGGSFFGSTTVGQSPQYGAFNLHGFYASDHGSPPLAAASNGVWRRADQQALYANGDLYDLAPPWPSSTWRSHALTQAGGMDLMHALNLAKPAGVFIELVHVPAAGSSGCGGATTRGPVVGRGRWTEE